MAKILLLEQYYYKGFTDQGQYTDYHFEVTGHEFDTVTKAVTSYTVDRTENTSEPQEYSRPVTEEFFSECLPDTFTKRSYFHNGTGGFTTPEAENSTDCGYIPPGTDPEPEPEPEPEVQGCTDPTADNYNPLATVGNADENLCAYSPKVFTEVKVVEVLPCSDGVCLRWFNNLGGIDTWVFAGKVDRPFTSEATGEFSHANGLKAAASKAGSPAMVLRAASLNYNRYQALWQLFTSPKVWIHHEDGSAEDVYVQPSSLPAMPIGRRSYDITVELAKAPINTLRK